MKGIIIIVVLALLAYVGYSLIIKQVRIQESANQRSGTQFDNASVSIKNLAFAPEILKVQQGTEITFRNEDNTPHTVTGDNFDSGTINEGGIFKQIFNEKGTFDYHCAIHQSMKGQIVVE